MMVAGWNIVGSVFTLDELAELCMVARSTVMLWKRSGRLQVKVRLTGSGYDLFVTPDEALRMWRWKFATPGDGSEADRVYQERLRQRRAGGLARQAQLIAKARGLQAKDL